MTIDELRERAESLGIKVDKRWGEAALEKRIADAENPTPSGIKAADHIPYAPEARPLPTEATEANPNTVVFTGDQASLLHANQQQRTFDALRRDEAREAADAAGKAAYDAVTNGLNARNRHAARKAARRLGFAGV